MPTLFLILFWLQDDGDVSDVDEKYFEPTKPTNSTNNHATASPNAKRKRLEPSSLTEQEQIEMAIGMCCNVLIALIST